MSINNLFAFIDKSFEIIPNPVQGASNKTLSKVPGNI